MTATTSQPTDTVVVRRAVRADRPDLDRLAQLDSARPLSGEVLLAESDGRLRAALALGDGRTIADPFSRSGSHVALLRTRAASLHAGRRHRPRLARPSLA